MNRVSMSSRKHSGSGDEGSSSPRLSFRSEQNLRPRANTMPSDFMRRLQEGKRRHEEETINQRRQAWVATDNDNGGKSPSRFHWDSHTVTHRRARSQTMPSGSACFRRPASSRDSTPTNLRLTALANSCKGRSSSMTNMTKCARNGTNGHIGGDRSPNSKAESSSEEHLEEYFNQCLSRLSDESLAVQRDPLPKGSYIFEQVLCQLEQEKIDLTKPQNTKSKAQKKVRRKSQPARTSQRLGDSPKEGRHVHWYAP